MARADATIRADLAEHLGRRRRAARRERLGVTGAQLLILLAGLGLWEYLTRVPWFVENTIADPFFVSRPSLVAAKLYHWTFGGQAGYLWPHLYSTLVSTLLGLVSC
jgi:NitT/TauT family transport system permease protein